MKQNNHKKIKKLRTKTSIASKQLRTRLCVFRSGRHLYAAIIDDSSGKTVTSVSDLKDSLSPRELGQQLAIQAKTSKIKQVVFDRSCYAYHGKIKELAEGARAGGLEF